MLKDFRKDFPQLEEGGADNAIVYFDNSCMTLKPKPVIDAINRYYKQFGACGGRSLHKLSTGVTIEIDRTRRKLADFLNVENTKEVLFTKNTTEGINLLSRSLPLEKGDLVLTSDREHNSNIVPWIYAKEHRGIRHQVVPSKKDGTFDMEKFKEMVPKAKAISMVHTSNLDGYSLPAREIAEVAHDHDVLVAFDGAQAMPHKEVDLKKIDPDFYAFSVHKMCGPTGVGVLWGKYDLLKEMDPFIVGGDTVEKVTYDRCVFLDPPNRFEAGLQNFAGIFGTGAAVDYLTKVGREKIHEHEIKLNKRTHEMFLEMPGLRIMGVQDPELRGGITSFEIDGFDPHDVAIVLDETADIMIRSGMHCVHSWFNAKNLKGSARVSYYLYNTMEEVDILEDTLRKLLGA